MVTLVLKIWVLFHFLYTLFLIAYLIAIPQKARSGKTETYQHKDYYIGLIALCATILMPFMFFFTYVYQNIPSGSYTINAIISKDYGKECVVPCDIQIDIVDEIFTEQDSDTIRYSKEYFLQRAYWPNGDIIEIGEVISPNGDELKLDKISGYYEIRTDKITQESVGLNAKTVFWKNACSFDGVVYLVSEILSIYVVICFVKNISKLEKKS